MMIKFNLSNKDSITLSYEKAKQVLESKEQLVMIYEDNKWSGKTINKAHIVSTVINQDANDEALIPSFRRLSAGDDEDRQQKIKERLKECRKELEEKGIIIKK